MIVIRRPHWGLAGGTICQIWLEAVPDDRFEHRLVNELLALAKPAGLGHVEAFARREEELEPMIARAVADAPYDGGASGRRRNHHRYDYVGGYRLKVTYYPSGIPVHESDPDEDALHLLHRGRPAVTSVAFEAMYGEGSLEGAVRLALQEA